MLVTFTRDSCVRCHCTVSVCNKELYLSIVIHPENTHLCIKLYSYAKVTHQEGTTEVTKTI